MTLDTVKDNLELLAAAAGVVGFIFSCLAGLLVWLWKLSGWVRGIETPEERETREKALSGSLEAIRLSMAQLTVTMAEREKDTNKIEGKLEMARDDFAKATGVLERLTASTESLWNFLSTKYPEIRRGWSR